MNELTSTVLCSVCLVVSVTISVLCIVNWIRRIIYKNKGVLLDNRKRGARTPFFGMVLGIFVAAMVMFIPIYLNNLEDPINWATYIKIPFLTAHNALRLFVVDADFEIVKDTIGGMPIANALQGIYTVVFALYYVIAPLLTGAFVLSLIKGLYESWRYKHSRPVKLYVMSELNENSLALAQDILRTYAYRDEDALTAEEIESCLDISEKRGVQDRKIKRTLVFANVTSQFEEENEELVEQAREMGAICLERDITEISLKTKRRDITRKLYFIGINEDENVTKATQMIEVCNSKANVNSSNTYIYVFAISEESGIVIDSCILHEREIAAQRVYNQNNDAQNEKTKDKKPIDLYPAAFKIKVRRVDEARNLVWNTLLKNGSQLNAHDGDYVKKHSEFKEFDGETDVNQAIPYLFQSAVERDGVKHINVLIVGLGRYGGELLKTMCWLSQMPGYRLHAYVFDGAPNAEDRFRAVCPELVDKRMDFDSDPIKGEAYYCIKFYNGVDVNAASFMQQIEAIEERITLAFVTLGADRNNIDTALKLRRSFGKMYGNDVPLILTAVYSSDKTRYLNRGHILVGDKGDDYRIRFIGDTASRYSLANIQQTRLESMGEACHMQWSVIYNADAAAWEASKVLYDYVEYNHVTSMGQALYLIAREAVVNEMSVKPDGETLAIYEHMRWNAFMRSLGYRVVPTVTNGEGKVKVYKNNLIRVHSSLVPFDELPVGEQAKDDRRLSEIVQMVRDRECALFDCSQSQNNSEKE